MAMCSVAGGLRYSARFLPLAAETAWRARYQLLITSHLPRFISFSVYSNPWNISWLRNIAWLFPVILFTVLHNFNLYVFTCMCLLSFHWFIQSLILLSKTPSLSYFKCPVVVLWSDKCCFYCSTQALMVLCCCIPKPCQDASSEEIKIYSMLTRLVETGWHFCGCTILPQTEKSTFSNTNGVQWRGDWVQNLDV